MEQRLDGRAYDALLERQAGPLEASNLYEAFDEKMKLLPKGQKAVNEFVKIRQGPNLAFHDFCAFPADGLDKDRSGGGFGRPKTMDKGIPVRAHFVDFGKKISNALLTFLVRKLDRRHRANPAGHGFR